MSRQTIIQSYQLKGDKHFLLPEIETIQDFLQSAEVATKPPSRLHYPIETLWPSGDFKTLYGLACRPHGKAVSFRCYGWIIGRYDVFHGDYHCDMAILRATDPYSINNVWISLITWSGYQAFVQEALS